MNANALIAHRQIPDLNPKIFMNRRLLHGTVEGLSMGSNPHFNLQTLVEFYSAYGGIFIVLSISHGAGIQTRCSIQVGHP